MVVYFTCVTGVRDGNMSLCYATSGIRCYVPTRLKLAGEGWMSADYGSVRFRLLSKVPAGRIGRYYTVGGGLKFSCERA